MSATINSGKLKFSVFGNGFEQTRNDSGSGYPSYEKNISAYNCAIDNTNTYMWLVTSGGLKKYQISTFTEVAQSTIPTSVLKILHPNNVLNNYGVAFDNGDTAYIFDLTDDTVIATISGTFPGGTGFPTYDCILVGDKIYYTWLHIGNTNIDMECIDLTNLTQSSERIIGGVGANGFINDSSIYATYTREWFYQSSCAYNVALDGTVGWSNTGINRNADIDPWGLTGNGKLYLPCQIDGVWHFGEFDGTSNPTFNPVTPNRVFGEFDSDPSIVHANYSYRVDVQYGKERKSACMMTQQGLLYTDFHTVEKLDDGVAVPLAVSDAYIVCSDILNTKLFVYGI